MQSLSTRSALIAVVLTGVGCAKTPVDPLKCQFPEYVDRTTAETSTVEVKFSADWGEAPTLMRTRIFDADPDRFSIISCGRDAASRQWELRAVWFNLPVPPVYPIDVTSLSGEPLRDAAPDFSGSLSLCSQYGCELEVDRDAFSRYSGSDTGATSHITRYDRDAGRFVAEVVVKPGPTYSAPPTELRLNMEWNPAEIVPDVGSSGAGGTGSVPEAGAGGGPGG